MSPLTLLPAGVADIVMVLLGLACFALALWLVGVRDWRMYGVVALWPRVHRRDARLAPDAGHRAPRSPPRGGGGTRAALPGVLVGLAVAVKFFVWPLGVWLAATRRSRDAAFAAAVAAASLLLVLPFTSLHDYAHALTRLGESSIRTATTCTASWCRQGRATAWRA